MRAQDRAHPIGLPVFFMPGSMEQLVLGLFVCFASFGLYMMFAPYRLDRTDHLSQVCQVVIFFTLL